MRIVLLRTVISVAGASFAMAATSSSIARSVDAPTPLRVVAKNVLADAFKYVPGDTSRTREPQVIGAYKIPEAISTQIVEATAPGYLPVTLRLSDGTCVSYSANYYGNALSDGKLTPIGCEKRGETPLKDVPRPSPDHGSWRFIGTSWGMNAWVDDRTQTTVVTRPHAKTFDPFFTANFPVKAIMAMSDPHGAGADITFLGEARGIPLLVTVEVFFR